MLAIWSFTDNLNRAISSLVTILSTSIALIYAGYFDFITTHQFSGMLYISLAMAAGALVQIAVALPVDTENKPSQKGFNLAGFIPPILLAGFGIYQIRYQKPEFAYLLTLAILIISFLLGSFIFGFIIFERGSEGNLPW